MYKYNFWNRFMVTNGLNMDESSSESSGRNANVMNRWQQSRKENLLQPFLCENGHI